MWSLTSPRADRISGPEKFWPFPQKDFCNTIGHETDMPTALRNVRSQGQSGKHMLAGSFSGFDPTQTLRRHSAGDTPVETSQLLIAVLEA
jgi:hypothetical protein